MSTSPAALDAVRASSRRCYRPGIDADRLTPQLRAVVDAAESLDERLLVLLWVRKAEPTAELLEILGASRGDLTGALGRLAQAGLVSHHRPEGEQTHWFATAAGRAKGEALHRALAARPAEAKPAPAQPEAEPERGAPADHERLKTRRRVSIDQNEKTGFSWD